MSSGPTWDAQNKGNNNMSWIITIFVFAAFAAALALVATKYNEGKALGVPDHRAHLVGDRCVHCVHASDAPTYRSQLAAAGRPASGLPRIYA